MFEPIINLFERLVVAQERKADAMDRVAEFLSTTGVDAAEAQADLLRTPAPDFTPPLEPQETATQEDPVTVPTPAEAETTELPPPPQTATDWNPYTAFLKDRYAKVYADVIEAELAKHGIEVPPRWTGKQKHEKLIELGPVGEAAPEPAADPSPPEAEGVGVVDAAQTEAPSAQEPTEEPARAPAPSPATLDDVRQALSALGAAGRLQEGLAILQRVGGVNRLTDATTGAQLLTDEKIPEVYDAVLAALNGGGIG